jgi:hypothetical protein
MLRTSKYRNGKEPIPLAARSKVWVCGFSLAEITGLNSAGGIDIYLFLVLCVIM